MTDVTQGQDAPNDTALFNEAVSTTTLEKFENPPDPKPEEPKPADPPKPTDKPAEPDAPIPPGRLREESELRRRAERERDELQRRMDALLVRQPPQPAQPQPKTDLFENPDGFVDQRIEPRLARMQNEFQNRLEEMSRLHAIDRHGEEKVQAAYQALAQGMQRGDPEVAAAYQRVMASADPYGAIVRWHQQGETMRTIGGDLEAYRKRIIEEAMNDPEVQKQFLQNARGQASAAGNTVARPVKPVAASSPSLGDVGGGGQAQIVEPSDIDLFRQATSAKRR